MTTQSAALQRLIRHPRISIKALADASGKSLRFTYKAIEGERALPVDELRCWLPVIAIEDRDLALDLLSDLLSLKSAGIDARPAYSPERDAESLAVDALQAAEKLGAVASKIARYATNGIDCYEAQDLIPDLRGLGHEVDGMQSKAEGIASRSPQTTIGSLQ